MSKRAEDLAKKLFPDPRMEDYDDVLVYRADRDNAIIGRVKAIKIYEQAEKDTIERAIAWLKENVSKSIMGIGIGLDEPMDYFVPDFVWEEFRKAMEEVK